METLCTRISSFGVQSPAFCTFPLLSLKCKSQRPLDVFLKRMPRLRGRENMTGKGVLSSLEWASGPGHEHEPVRTLGKDTVPIVSRVIGKLLPL